MHTADRKRGNLTAQSHCLSDAERRELAGGLLVAACATVTSTNLCLPSETSAWWARHTQRKHPITTEGAKP